MANEQLTSIGTSPLPTEGVDLLQGNQEDLLSPPNIVPQFNNETSTLLSTLSQATQATFNSLDIQQAPSITNPQTEQGVREMFAAQEMLDKSSLVDELVLEKIIAGASPKEVEGLLGGEVQDVKEIAKSILEIKAAKFLSDSGMLSSVMQAKVVNEEFSPEGMERISSTDRREEFIATMLRFRTLRQKLVEKFNKENLGENALDLFVLGLVPGFNTLSQAKVFGRGVEKLGTSIQNFSKNFFSLPFNKRMEVLNQFEKDLEENTVVAQNVLQALIQVEDLLSFTDEDALLANLTEVLDATIIALPLIAIFRNLKTISAAGRFARFKDITPGRATVLKDKERLTTNIIEGEFEDVTPSGSKALTVLEEDELIENVIPSMGSLQKAPEKGVGPANEAVEASELIQNFNDVLPLLIEQLNKAGVDIDLATLNPVDLLGVLRGTIVPDVLNEVEQGAANIAAVRSILKMAGVEGDMRALIDPERYTGGVVSTKVFPTYDVDIEEVSRIRTVNVYLGTGDNFLKGFVSEEAALEGAKRLGLEKGFFKVSERTGEFYLKVSRNPGTVQYITPIDPKEIPQTIPVVSKYLAGRATTQTLDDLKGGLLSANAEERLGKAVTEAIANINPRTSPGGPGLSAKSRKIYNELMLDIQQRDKWLTGGQVVEWYQRNHGRSPTTRELKAYAATKEIYAFDYLGLNASLQNELVGAGYQEGIVKGLFKTPVVLKEVETTSLPPRQVKIYDTVQKKIVRVDDRKDLFSLLERGDSLMLVKNLTRNKKFGDYIIASREDVNIRPLRANVLNKVDGPHRIYDVGRFIKQQRIRFINGQETLVNPKTHFAIKSPSEAKKFVDDYNEALDAFVTARDNPNILTETKATAIINKNTRFSSFKEMEAAVAEGRLELTPFEALKDGEVPTFRKGEFAEQPLDPDFANFSDKTNSLIQSGRLFFSSRGPRLLHPKEGMAALVSPDAILDRAVSNVKFLQAYNNYKIRQTTRWVKTYEKFLIGDPNRPVYEKFLYGSFDTSPRAKIPMSSATLRNAEVQREGILRLLKSRGVLEESVSRYRDQIIDIIEARTNTNIADRAANIASGNPIVAMRGIAFKAFLGFFDSSQLIVQASMTPGVLAVSPIAGAKALPMYPFIRAALVNPGVEEVTLQAYSKSPLKSLLNLDQFKRLIQDIKTSGIDIIGNTLGDLDIGTNHGNLMTMGGAFLKRTTDGAMLFFNEAEKFVRVLGFTIAWLENFEKTGKGLSTADDFATVGVRGRALAGNMSRNEKAYWQNGILSLGTQFIAQPVRLTELLFFPTPGGFDKKSKIRWYIGLALAYGPLLGFKGDQGPTGSIAEYVKQRYFEATGDEIPQNVLTRFLTDGLVGVLLPDTDISRLQPFGQGFLLSDIFDEEKGVNIWDMLGASGAIGNRFYDATLGSAKLWAFISADIDVDLIPLSLMEIANDVVKNTLVSYNRIQKSIHAYQTGQYVNTRGDVLQEDIDEFDAAMIGLGFPPLRSTEAFIGSVFMNEFRKKVFLDAKEAAKYITKAMAAEEGSQQEKLNLAYFNYIKKLYHVGDLSGDGAALFAKEVTRILEKNNVLTENVRIRFMNILGRDPESLKRSK